MREKIFTIEDRFKIQGKGLAIVWSIENEYLELEIGTPLIIVCPDGREFETEISGIENILTVSGVKKEALLIANSTKDELLIGSDVFVDKT